VEVAGFERANVTHRNGRSEKWVNVRQKAFRFQRRKIAVALPGRIARAREHRNEIAMNWAK